jgi:hypothetical protein
MKVRWPAPPVETYARTRYLQGLKSWRRWVRRRLLPVFAPIFVGSCVWGVLEHHQAAFIAGFIAGGSGAMFIGLREFAPPYVENWGRGSEGERKTHDELVTLGWTLVDDVDTGRGNYDHIVAGPAGVFLIETKNLTGITEIRGGDAWLRRRHDRDGDQRQTRLKSTVLNASRSLSAEIRTRTGRRRWVYAIVVFWNEFPDGIVKAGDVTYVHGSKLKSYLGQLPTSLSDQEQIEIGRALAELKQAGEQRAGSPAAASITHQ